MQKWQRIDPTTVTRVGWRTITSKTFIMGNGKKTVFDTLHADDQEFVSVIALTPNKKVVVVENFQYGPEKIMEDLPGGFVDVGEDREVAMRRELLEETGYCPDKVAYLGKFHKDAYMNATWHTFIAYDCVKVQEQHLDLEEEITVRLISPAQLIDNAKTDRLNDHGSILFGVRYITEFWHGYCIMKGWQRIEPTISTKIDYHNVIIKTFKLPDDTIVTRATFLAEDRRSAGIIAVTKENKVVVARQFRPGPERVMDDLPGGYVDVGEDPQAAACRELLEETGYEVGDVSYLGEFDRDAYVNGHWYYYLATNCERVRDQALDHDEFVSVELRSIPEFISSAKQGDMTDPYAVLAALDQLMEIQEKETL